MLVENGQKNKNYTNQMKLKKNQIKSNQIKSKAYLAQIHTQSEQTRQTDRNCQLDKRT